MNKEKCTDLIVKVSLFVGDLTKLEIDAVVSTTNNYLLSVGQGILILSVKKELLELSCSG